MRKILAVVLAVLLLGAVVPLPAKPVVQGPGWLKRISASVLPLQKVDGKIYCSSFVIAKDTVQTAFHCVASSDGQLTVAGDPQVELIYADPKLDSAVLRVLTKELQPLKAAVNSVLPGEKVIGIGYALGLRKLTLVEGLAQEATARYLITEPMVIPGMSGGPVLNANGEVVAMNHMSYGETFHKADLGLNIQLIRQHDRQFWED
jgi:S1-C subfamily serine protease